MLWRDRFGKNLIQPELNTLDFLQRARLYIDHQPIQEILIQAWPM